MKKLISLILSLLLLASFALSASAEETYRRIVDGADLLDPAEEAELEAMSEFLLEEYSMDVVILTLDSLEGYTPQEMADDFYDYYGYGYGEEKSGLLLLISMEERDWYISTCGEAIYALTDYGIQQIANEMLEGFGTSYAEGFRRFMNALPGYFEAYRSGAPIDGYADYSGDYYHGDQEEVVYYDEEFTPSVTVSFLVGLVVAGISVLIMRIGMNTRRPQRSAAEYMQSGSFRMNRHQDLFLYSNISKVRKQEPSSSGSSGGGSSVHRSSGGRSHGGGGGKF